MLSGINPTAALQRALDAAELDSVPSLPLDGAAPEDARADAFTFGAWALRVARRRSNQPPAAAGGALRRAVPTPDRADAPADG